MGSEDAPAVDARALLPRLLRPALRCNAVACGPVVALTSEDAWGATRLNGCMHTSERQAFPAGNRMSSLALESLERPALPLTLQRF